MPLQDHPRRATAVILCMILASLPVRAKTVLPASFAVDVDAMITQLVGEIELFRFSDAHLAIIKSLAYQEGADVICPGFDTDQHRRIDILAEIVPMRDEQFRTASTENLVLRSEVMFAFGTHFGATIAVGMADTTAFCADAENRRNDPNLLSRIWLPQP
jgi:hypothetical protein